LKKERYNWVRLTRLPIHAGKIEEMFGQEKPLETPRAM